MDITKWKIIMKGRDYPADLDTWLEGAVDADLFRINLKLLADRLKIDWHGLFETFLYGVKGGAFDLNWEYHCPHCNGLADFKHNLKDVKSDGFCGLCNVAFRNTLDQNIEVTFTVHPGLKTLPPTVMEEARATAIAAIQAGTFKMPEKYLTGLECMNNKLFQDLFGSDVLSDEESLQISRVTILFTDIKGSTEMYSKLGDTASYRIVREHFKILFQQVEAHGGVVVKTIGDAVMASFLRPEDGVKAALGAYDEFKKRTWDPVGNLEIKMGLHTGSVIVVNLNDRVDYFGNTVNTAARIQGVADNHTVCFSQEVLGDLDVKKTLARWTKQNSERLFHRQVRLKGINGAVDFYRIADKEPVGV